nr:MAG TPA: putative septation protein [Caudoviricetes sp.]
MAFAKSNNASYQKKTADGPRVTVEMLHNLHAVVRTVRQVADNCLTFTLCLYGIDLYSMRLVEGQKGTFITASAKKGKDGEYYDNFRVYFAEDAAQAVETAVRKAYDTNANEVEV